MILFLLFSMCAPAHAVNFVEIVDISDMMISVDTDSIEKGIDYNHEYIVVRTKHALPSGEGDMEYYLNFLALNEAKRQFQVLSV